MRIVFRRFTAESPPPAPGELHVRAPDPGPAGERVAMTLKALREGPGGFPSAGSVECLVVDADPTLDDVLAAHVLGRQLAGEKLPADVPLAHYAAALARGHHPAEGVPPDQLIEGVFAHYRHAAGDPLTDDARAAKFLAAWPKLAELLDPALRDPATDPFRQSLLADRRDFHEECLYLRNDRALYEQDVRDGERWLVRLPKGEAETPKREGEFPALVLREPTSVLFKFWARSDPDAAGAPPKKAGYHFLVVLWGEKDWWFSTDPVDRYDIRSLAAKFQAAEVKKNPARLGADGKDPDPWYNGKRHGHSLVRPPKADTALSEQEVLAVVAEWGQARRVPQPQPEPVPGPGPKPAGALRWRWVAAAVLAAVGLSAWLFWPPPPPPSPTPERLAFARTDAGSHWRRPSALQDKWEGVTSWDVPAGKRHEKTVSLKLQDPKRPILVWLQSNGKKPPEGIQIHQPGSGQTEAKVETIPSWSAVQNNIWRTPPLHFQSAENERLTVVVPDPAGGPYELELLYRVNPHDIHLHFLAVGIGKYGDKAGVASIDACRKDAEKLTEEFKAMAGPLFTRVDVLNPPLLDERATDDGIKTALAAFRDRVRDDDAPLKLAVVAFSGHGDVYDNRVFKFLPHNHDKDNRESGVFLADIKRILGDKPPCPTVIILNACRSGAATEQPRPDQSLTAPPTGPVPDDALGKLVAGFRDERPAYFVLAAASKDDSAFVNLEHGHGALSLAVLEVLRGEAPGGKDGLYTLNDLWNHAWQRVPKLAGQEPQRLFPGRPEVIPIAYSPRRK